MDKQYIPIKEPSSPAQMAKLSHDDATRLVAQRQEESARLTMINALITMGRFEEALALDPPDEKKAWIETLMNAEAEDDDKRCECIAVTDVTDYLRTPDGPKKTKVIPKYVRRARHWSLKYNAMVNLYTCVVCGHAQTINGPIDDDYEALEAQRSKALKGEIAKTPVRVYPNHKSEEA